jgi:prevent-host-death family protein
MPSPLAKQLGAVDGRDNLRHTLCVWTTKSVPSAPLPVPRPDLTDVGCHEFRNHFGYYLERAAAGEEVRISRRGRPYARLVPAEPAQPTLAAA